MIDAHESETGIGASAVRRLVVAVILALLVVAPARADYEAGEAAYQRGDYGAALREWRPLAEAGDARAQLNLGFMYAIGYGVPKDHVEAFRWWHKAAEQGDAASQFNLGLMYFNGQGVAKDEADAVRWYRKAADQGVAKAQLMLGIVYKGGLGVARDLAAAVRWYRKAADQGSALAQYNLGDMYRRGAGVAEDAAESFRWYRKAAEQGDDDAQERVGALYQLGKGVAKNAAEAARWYRRAADQGNVAAQGSLGYMYSLGEGVPLDDVQAYAWLNLAAGQGDLNAAKGRDNSTTVMTPAQIAGAQKLAREWKPKKEERPPEILAFLRSATPPAVTPRLAPPAGLDFGRYHALVIGNNAYKSLPRLESAVADAEAVAALLRDAYGFQATVLKDASRDDIIKALDGFRTRLGETDNLLIYYAGHGWLDRGSERGYWLPVDADDKSRARWLSNSDLTDTLKAVLAKRVIVVADSCYSGTLARSAGEMRGLELVGREPDYLSRMLEKKVRTVLSSGTLEPVSDRGGGRHSVFAKAFMDALRDNSGVKDGTEIFAMVREQVRLNAPQLPQYANIQYAGHEVGGDFLFVRRR